MLNVYSLNLFYLYWGKENKKLYFFLILKRDWDFNFKPKLLQLYLKFYAYTERRRKRKCSIFNSKCCFVYLKLQFQLPISFLHAFMHSISFSMQMFKKIKKWISYSFNFYFFICINVEIKIKFDVFFSLNFKEKVHTEVNECNFKFTKHTYRNKFNKSEIVNFNIRCI